MATNDELLRRIEALEAKVRRLEMGPGRIAANEIGIGSPPTAWPSTPVVIDPPARATPWFGSVSVIP